jgi:hypothetical protein
MRTAGTGESDDTGWDGHAVAYVPERIAGGQAWLVDLSATQFDLPQHGFALAPLVLRSATAFCAVTRRATTSPAPSSRSPINPPLPAS